MGRTEHYKWNEGKMSLNEVKFNEDEEIMKLPNCHCLDSISTPFDAKARQRKEEGFIFVQSSQRHDVTTL